MSKKQLRKSDAAAVVSEDGSLSNASLHEQTTAGVDDSDIRAQSRAQLHAAGIPAAALKRLFPDLFPLQE